MSNSIAFENLRVEMARKQLTISQIAATVGMNRETLGRKLSRISPLNLNEAFDIVVTCFPELSVEYIFKEACTFSEKKNFGTQ